jgi:glycosyltransferase involved in cell wall biosynthesis
MSVQIMLSTFNGDAFLGAQLDSLLEQDFPALEIIIRDDGSTDCTPQILLGYAAIHRNIHVSLGRNIGYVKSFFTLLAQEASSPSWRATRAATSNRWPSLSRCRLLCLLRSR